MPLRSGKKNVSLNISEFHKGKTYKKTLRKHGKATADKQAIAVAMSAARRGKKRKPTKNESKFIEGW